MIECINLHVINIGKRLKQKEEFERNCREEFERMFGSIRVSEPEDESSVIVKDFVKDGKRIVIRRKL